MNKSRARLIAICFAFFYFVLSLVVSCNESTTMDERAHIGAAYTYLNALDMRLNPEHPPLFKDFAGLPLQFLHPLFPYDSNEWKNGINEQWSLGVRFIHQNDAQQITNWSRFPIILVSITLGLFLFYWTGKRYGIVASVIASALFFFDPNIIAHGHYVTTDMGIATSTFLAIYFFLLFLEKQDKKSFLLCALFLGIAQLTKFSAIMLFPYYIAMATLWTLTAPSAFRSIVPYFKKTSLATLRIWLICLGLFLTSFIPVWTLYTFNTWNMPMDKILAINESAFRHEGPSSFHAHFVRELSDLPILKNLTTYFLGLFMVLVRVDGGNTFYFMYDVFNTAKQSYFPILFILKETVPFLLLFFASLISTTRMATSRLAIIFFNRSLDASTKLHLFSTFIRTYFTEIALISYVGMYFYVSITGNLNIGLRHLFPVFPILFMLCAGAITGYIAEARNRSLRKSAVAVVSILLLWQILIPVVSYPSYLSYFNEFAGGPKNGYKYALDSNYDWGQDLLNLQKWVNNFDSCVEKTDRTASNCAFMEGIPAEAKKSPIKEIHIDYFGGADPQYYFGDKFIQWHADSAPTSGWFAVSAEYLQENIYNKKNATVQNYKWLARKKPVDRAGDSIFIFYVANKPISAPTSD